MWSDDPADCRCVECIGNHNFGSFPGSRRTTMPWKVTIYHGPEMMLWPGEDPRDTPLLKVMAFFVTPPADTDPHLFAERMWAAGNGHPNPGDDDLAEKYYRTRQIRSLCVGDVVVFGEAAMQCQSMGWERIDLPDHTIVEPGHVHNDRWVATTDGGWRPYRPATPQPSTEEQPHP